MLWYMYIILKQGRQHEKAKPNKSEYRPIQFYETLNLKQI